MCAQDKVENVQQREQSATPCVTLNAEGTSGSQSITVQADGRHWGAFSRKWAVALPLITGPAFLTRQEIDAALTVEGESTGLGLHSAPPVPSLGPSLGGSGMEYYWLGSSEADWRILSSLLFTGEERRQGRQREEEKEAVDD